MNDHISRSQKEHLRRYIGGRGSCQNGGMLIQSKTKKVYLNLGKNCPLLGVHFMMDTGSQKMLLILSSIQNRESSILPGMAQNLMPMRFSFLAPACPVWVISVLTFYKKFLIFPQYSWTHPACTINRTSCTFPIFHKQQFLGPTL